jgi:CheY-like chemotaxis protein
VTVELPDRPVLLVEDDYVDQLLVKRAVCDLRVSNPVEVAATGEGALARLRAAGAQEPCLILLDLHMPRLGGLELLRILHGDARLQRIPVVVLTTLAHEPERVASLELGAAAVLTKPMDYRRLVDDMRGIYHLWSRADHAAGPES